MLTTMTLFLSSDWYTGKLWSGVKDSIKLMTEHKVNKINGIDDSDAESTDRMVGTYRMNQIQREKGTEKRYDFSESFKSFLTRGGGVRTYGVGVR